MATYYEVTVKEKFEDEKGKIKSKSKKLLVEAVSVTDAEARTVKLYEGVMFEYEVTGAKESSIKELVLDEKE